MDAAAHHAAALLDRVQCERNQRAHRRKQDRRVQRLGRRLGGVAGPMCAALQRKGLSGRVAWAGEGEHLPSLSPRHLREDVRRGAEAIQAEVLRIIRLGEGSEADQSRTEQRRRPGIAVMLRQRHAVALVGHRVLGITAWNMKSREARPVAKVLATAPAVLAFPAGPAEPWNADAGADSETL